MTHTIKPLAVGKSYPTLLVDHGPWFGIGKVNLKLGHLRLDGRYVSLFRFAIVYGRVTHVPVDRRDTRLEKICMDWASVATKQEVGAAATLLAQQLQAYLQSPDL